MRTPLSMNILMYVDLIRDDDDGCFSRTSLSLTFQFVDLTHAYTSYYSSYNMIDFRI